MAIRLPTALGGTLRGSAKAEFRSILIPVNAEQGTIPWEMLDVASRLADERRGAIELLVFSLIPLSEDLNVEIPGIEGRLRRLVAQTETAAARCGIRVRWSHLRTRDAAATILSGTDRAHAELILLGATDTCRSDYRRVARDDLVRRVSAHAHVPVLFVRPSPDGA
jgi:nucleotide-binding universal stress UspA family protein